MRRQNTALISCGWHKVEIELSRLFMWVDQPFVNDAAWRWVAWGASIILDEEALVDSFVDHDDDDFRKGLILVKSFYTLLKLRHFVCKNLSSLGVTHSISIDDDCSWELVTIVMWETSESFTEWLLDFILFNDFLALSLHKVVRVVLWHLFIDRRGKTNDGLWTRMTNVNTNQHGALLLHLCWEFQIVKITASFAINLSENVGGFRQIKFVRVSCGDDLWRKSVGVHDLLDLVVVIFPLQDKHDH